jgi:sugar phosphate isomerase/epimerase
MLLSSSIKNLLTRFDPETAIRMMAKAGFDAMDFSFTGKSYAAKYCGPDANTPAFRDYLRGLRAQAEDAGVPFLQAHAPAPSSSIDPLTNRERFDAIVVAMRNSSCLGIPKIVVHPVQHLTYAEDGVPERLFEMNLEFYKRLEPYCEEYNIKIAVENMWQRAADRRISHSTCSRPAEFARYVDALDSEWFIGCLDIGHAYLVDEDPAAFIEHLGGTRLKALHVHDVDGVHDSHTIPYQGKVDWESVMAALARIGYEGELTYEAVCFLDKTPDAAYPSGLSHMAEIGRYLISRFEAYRRELAK